MNDRARAFDLLCEYLSVRPSSNIVEELTAAAETTPSFWVEFIRISKEQLVGPALGLSFETHGLSGMLPSVVERYCRAILRLNRARNKQIRAEAIALTEALNRIDVVPVFLKGGSNLLSGLYEDAGARILSDLDVLIPIDRARDCARHLTAMGFEEPLTKSHPRDHSVGVFLGEHSAAPIDLHHEVVAWPNRRLLSARETIRDSVRCNLDGVTAAVPSLTHQIIINIGHAHLNDYGYRYGSLPLRSLYDFALLLQTSAGIDWKLVEERFSEIGELCAVDYHCLAVGDTLKALARPGHTPSLISRFLLQRARFLTRHPRLQADWFRFARVAMLLRRELSDKDLRARLIRNMQDRTWWHRQLGFFWRGEA